ncbi:SAM-dependent methyltransferase [Streptosporangium sp. NPDC002524]|uniref:SAM-dependent methyltransferase n=1 Tax=Streptosporangium sp. NPDC002524 TaxID=3154537 RepID=UPI003323136F
MTRPTGEPGLPTGVSRTAVVIAQAREAESARPDRLFDDPLAGPLAGAAGRIAGISEAGRRAGEHFVLRTRFFDDRLREAVAAGPRQVVLLAAGLDTRAFRLDWPEGTRLFEVDLPDLISFKERALADRGARPACDRTVVAADLRGDWSSPLLAAGLDPAGPIAWLIEGVLMYLTPGDGARLLGRVSELSSLGSRLAVEHVNRAYAELPQMRPAMSRLTSTQAAWRSTVEDPRAWLAGYGWRASVTHQADLARELGRPVPAMADPGVVGPARIWLVDARRDDGRYPGSPTRTSHDTGAHLSDTAPYFRDIHSHPRDIDPHSHDIRPHPRDIDPHSHDIRPHPRDIDPHSRDTDRRQGTTTMPFTDQNVRELLLAVGLDPATGDDALELSFDELDLDSLARVEIATQIQDRFGVDVEEQLTAEATPSLMRELVTERLAATGA